MQILTVELGARAYPIHIGQGLIDRSEILIPYLRSPSVAIVTNATVAPLYLQRFSAPLKAAGVKVVDVVLPDGEKYKQWETLNSIFDVLLAQRCDRSTTLIALGGGVIGDMTGFAAGCYQRGVPFIQIPTTLLSQVDSSIGGKTAINHPLGKNMIGLFNQPKLVLADTDVLNSLPDRELKAGLAEVIKIALIRDLPFLEWLELNLERLVTREPDAMAYAISRACANKAEVVIADERENGDRALLNLGHTFGHAIETALGYGQWLHGEAVAAGTMMAAELSRQLGFLSRADVLRIEHLFARSGLPVRGPAIDGERYLELMQHDKKVQDGKLRLVLLSKLGVATLNDSCTREQIINAIRERTTSA